ncbi:PHB depolymerase family esterase [Aestuariibacter salexigens]|uniref:extracellular catalytic domain type 2 short-chain-length polyhydroxyalkanoate depolymerase n=1 Tax=Aestuariibacter salexigens TaxID=226010 RepID=UPI0003FDEBFC|nr:PHB depolymerase family esterase [Aestuariibacter salexigens]
MKYHYLFGASALLCASAAAELPDMQLDIEQVTVSGLSSGGYMATQFHLAYADWVSGAAIISAGPYPCARNSITTALSQCVNKVDGDLDVAALSDMAASWAAEGKIAPLEALKGDKVWLLHGTIDERIIEPVSDALTEQYRNWAGAENVVYVNDKPFSHHFPTETSGHACDVSEAPFVGACNYDAAGNLLSHLYGELYGELSAPAETLGGTLYSFDQQQLGGDAAASLADEGFVYIPESCVQGQTCKVHINFHGCNQFAEVVGDEYVRLNGLNRWADSNNLVVLYPQAKASMFMPLNPQGCWDWWGYTSEHYATAEGEQPLAVKTMVNNLAKK